MMHSTVIGTRRLLLPPCVMAVGTVTLFYSPRLEWSSKDLLTPLSDPALSMSDVTFCIWRTKEDGFWKRGDIAFANTKDPDGSADLPVLLGGNPSAYQAWAEEYYEREISLDAVKCVYKHQPLTRGIVTAINPQITWDDLEEDIEETDYPSNLE